MTFEEFVAGLAFDERAVIDLLERREGPPCGWVLFDGEPTRVSVITASIWFEKCNDWRIGLDTVGTATISTVLLRVTCPDDDDCFETLASGVTDGEIAIARYRTLDAARAAHAAIVAEAQRLWHHRGNLRELLRDSE